MEIRKAKVDDARGIAKVHIDTWRTTYKGIVPEDHLSELSYEKLEGGWTKILQQISPPEAVFVVEDSEEGIVGFVRVGPCQGEEYPYDAELHAIYLYQCHQRKGLGKQLFFHATRYLLQHEMKSLILWVLVDNSASHFYKALGGEVVANKRIDIGGKSLPAIAYAWLDLEQLVWDD